MDSDQRDGAELRVVRYAVYSHYKENIITHIILITSSIKLQVQTSLIFFIDKYLLFLLIPFIVLLMKCENLIFKHKETSPDVVLSDQL